MDWFGKSVFFNKENEKLFKFEKSLFSNEIYTSLRNSTVSNVADTAKPYNQL